MNDLEIDRVADVDLTEPAFLEGLPGVGHVGKLAAEHLLEELDSTLVARVYSPDLPPQVDVGDDGVAELTHAEFHAVETDGRDLLVLTGDHQAQTNEGHYRMASAFLDVAADYDCADVYALGGVPTGELIDEYDVLGAATSSERIADLEDLGVEFREDEPAGGIVGVSGLLLGLGARRDLEAACLMGETSGYLVDPKSARAVLEVLAERFDLDLDYESLEDRADEMEDVIEKIQQMEQQQTPQMADDDLRYIG
jgi:uncharacterized protein (TIGR00162 family)